MLQKGPPPEEARLEKRVSQFYVTDTKSARIAIEAARDRKVITISGMVGKGIRFFTGVVESVKEDQLTVPKRWRVTILDGKQIDPRSGPPGWTVAMC
jgi:hypothetical protein